MIDLTCEQPLSLAAAARLIPAGRGGKKTHISTLTRWILTGSKDPAGNLVKLEALRLGGRWMTSREALQRFAERLTPTLGEAGSAPALRTSTSRRRASERAAKELDRAGI